MPTLPRRLLPALLAAAVLPLATPAFAHAAPAPVPRDPRPPRVAHHHAGVALVPATAAVGLRGDVLLAPSGAV